MARIAVGILLVLISLWGLGFYHQALWNSGGPDSNRSLLPYFIPYFVTVASTIFGLVIIWKGYKLVRRRDNFF